MGNYFRNSSGYLGRLWALRHRLPQTEIWREDGLVWQDGAGDTAAAQVPGHCSADRSITFSQIDGRVLMNSHADDKGAVLDALGLTTADLFDDPKGTTYSYSEGRRVHRTPGKKFRQTGNASGTALFRAERLAVYVVEGERYQCIAGRLTVLLEDLDCDSPR